MDRPERARSAAADVTILTIGFDLDERVADRFGARAMRSASGAEAVAGVGEHPLAVVVLDTSVVDPISLTQRLPAHVPVVVLADPEEASRLRSTLMTTPLIGSDVSVIAAGTDSIVTGETIGVAVQRARRRAADVERSAGFARADVAKIAPRPLTGHLGEVLDHIPVGVALIGPDGQILAWNGPCSTLLGISEREAAGWPLMDLFADRDGIGALLAAASDPATSGALSVTTRVRGPREPDLFEVSVRRVPGRTGAPPAIAVVRDVTEVALSFRERQRSRDEAMRAAAVLRLALETGELGHLEVHGEECVVSNRAKIHHGFPPSSPIHTLDELLEHVEAHDAPAVARALRDAAGPVTYRVEAPEIGPRWIELAVGASGSDRIAISRDVTISHIRELDLIRDRVEAEDTTERLRRLDEQRTVFLRALSHDVRGPLASVLGFAHTLLERADELPAETLSTAYRSIAQNAERVLTLITTLIEQGMTDAPSGVGVEPIAIGEVVRALIGPLDPRGHTILVEAGDLTWRVDRTAFERIVDNLVRNAVRHTPAGCTIVVRAREEDGSLVIAVDDDGPGVPEAERPAILEAFSTGSTSSPGTGLGLWLVARLASLHGGELRVEEATSGGASFKVRLPDPSIQARAGIARGRHPPLG